MVIPTRRHGESHAFRLALGAGLGALSLWLAFRSVPLRDVGRAVAAAQAAWVAVGVLAILGATVFRAWRWKLLFPPAAGRPPFARLWTILLVGQTMNILVPARAGDLLRVVLVAETDARAKAETLATIALEKLFDTAVFLGLAGLVSTLMVLPGDLALARAGLVWGSVGLIAAALVVVAAFDPLARRAVRLAWLPSRWRDALVDQVLVPAGRGAWVLRRPPLVVTTLVLSLATWGASWFANYCCLVALRLESAALAALLVLVVLQLGTAVVTSPGGLGVFEYLCVVALAAFGVPRSDAAAYGVLLHGAAYLPPVALGAAVVAWTTARGRMRADAS